MHKKWVFPLFLAVAGLTAGIWLAQTRYAPQPPAASALTALWQLTYPDVEGHPQKLSQWRGQAVVINFWASWCAPCREEMPDFVDMKVKFRQKNIEFVGIAIDNAANVREYLAKFPVTSDDSPTFVHTTDRPAIAYSIKANGSPSDIEDNIPISASLRYGKTELVSP